MIVGVGLDLVAVDRVQRLVDPHGDRFLTRCFDPDELHRPADAEHLAGLLAAKEAAFKAMGLPRGSGVGWRDLTALSPSGGGPPQLRFAGRAITVVEGRGITRSWLSITHHGGLAAAVVILEA